MQRFDPKLLTALDALLTERSVSRAASRLNVSQPTMSGILLRLRLQFDDPLLVRTGSELLPTQRAVELAPSVREALVAIDQVFRPREPFRLETAQCHFTIMASDYGLQLLLPAVIRKAERDAPGISFSILPILNPIESICEGIADLCLVGDPSVQRERKRAQLIRTRVVLREHYVCLVDADNAMTDAVSAEQYRTGRRATIRLAHGAPTLEQMILPNVPDEPPQIVASGFHSLGEILPRTNMMALLPHRVANRLAHMHSLRTLPIDFACGRPELRMLWHAERDRDAGHKWMREQVAISGAAISV